MASKIFKHKDEQEIECKDWMDVVNWCTKVYSVNDFQVKYSGPFPNNTEITNIEGDKIWFVELCDKLGTNFSVVGITNFI